LARWYCPHGVILAFLGRCVKGEEMAGFGGIMLALDHYRSGFPGRDFVGRESKIAQRISMVALIYSTENKSVLP